MAFVFNNQKVEVNLSQYDITLLKGNIKHIRDLLEQNAFLRKMMVFDVDSKDDQSYAEHSIHMNTNIQNMKETYCKIGMIVFGYLEEALMNDQDKDSNDEEDNE